MLMCWSGKRLAFPPFRCWQGCKRVIDVLNKKKKKAKPQNPMVICGRCGSGRASHIRHLSQVFNVLAFYRLVFKGMGISRPDAIIGKCRMIRHSRDRKNEPNPERCVSPHPAADSRGASCPCCLAFSLLCKKPNCRKPVANSSLADLSVP